MNGAVTPTRINAPAGLALEGGEAERRSNAIPPDALKLVLRDDAEITRPRVIEPMLSGGDRRSLHGVADVIRIAADETAVFDELFTCLFSGDELVRMRAADALEKIARLAPQLFVTYRRRLLNDVAKIDQPSVQWHLAQILAEIELTPTQRAQAIRILRRNLERYEDRIVINLTLGALAQFARNDPRLRAELIPILRQHQSSRHKSTAKRAAKLLAGFPPLHDG